MTVIAAMFDGNHGRAALATDRMTQAGDVKHLAAPKVVRLGRLLYAGAGLSLARRYWHRLAGPEDGESIEAWAWRAQEGWHAWLAERRHGSQREDVWGVDFHGLAVGKDGIVELTAEGNVTLIQQVPGLGALAYHAAGSGGSFALGALHVAVVGMAPDPDALIEVCPDPSAIVRMAAEAAVAHAVGCEGPIDVLDLDWLR